MDRELQPYILQDGPCLHLSSARARADYNQCIRGWRDPAGKSVDVLISQMNKTCPSCRSRSRFIIPSSRFPGSTDSKKTIVDNYKASMARKDCRSATARPSASARA